MSIPEKVLKDLEGALEYLPAFESVGEFGRDMGEKIEKIDSLTTRSNLCFDVARLYKYISKLEGIGDETKEKAKKQARYFLQKAAEYGNQYEIQREMIPEFFNVDKPIC